MKVLILNIRFIGFTLNASQKAHHITMGLQACTGKLGVIDILSLKKNNDFFLFNNFLTNL